MIFESSLSSSFISKTFLPWYARVCPELSPLINLLPIPVSNHTSLLKSSCLPLHSPFTNSQPKVSTGRHPNYPLLLNSSSPKHLNLRYLTTSATHIECSKNCTDLSCVSTTHHAFISPSQDPQSTVLIYNYSIWFVWIFSIGSGTFVRWIWFQSWPKYHGCKI